MSNKLRLIIIGVVVAVIWSQPGKSEENDSSAQEREYRQVWADAYVRCKLSFASLRCEQTANEILNGYIKRWSK